MLKPRKPLQRKAWLARSTKPLKRGGKPKAVNRKRKASEFVRCYGGRARVSWIARQWCVISGEGPCENVHVRGDGMGRKADARWIVPMVSRLHRELHRIGKISFECVHGVDLDYLAEETEVAWQASQGER